MREQASWVTIKNYKGEDFSNLVISEAVDLVESGDYQLLKIIVGKLNTESTTQILHKAIEVNNSRLVKYIIKYKGTSDEKLMNFL